MRNALEHPDWTPSPALRAGAFELAAGIRARKSSSIDVVDAHIARIRETHSRLNALMEPRFEAARAEAAAADRRIAAGEVLPLLGVPFTVKEMLSVAGMPHTQGALARRDWVAERDATVVARLRAAGAIPLGVSNVPEWGMWFETYNLLRGRTSNPYDARRIAGGSSGGEGALVGAGASPFGLGSDIGGSIRMPAAFCGVFGHKPSAGLLPLTGHFPVYATGREAHLERDSPYVALGPLARSARDLWPLLHLMAGPDGADPNCNEMPLAWGDADEWHGRRVVVLADPRIARAGRTHPVLRDAVRRAARILGDRGARLVEADPLLLRDAVDIWFGALQSSATRSFREIVGEGEAISLTGELLRTATGHARYSMPALLFCAGESVGRLNEQRLARAVAARERLQATLDELLGDDGVLLLPVHPRVAPRHTAPVLRPFDFAFTAIFNALRVPATAVPVGLDASGLPLSVQLVARHGRDALTIAGACALEAALGGWSPPRA